MVEQTTCIVCGQSINQTGGGHRIRLYCDDTCKQAAFRARREQEHTDEVTRRWSSFTAETRTFLDWLRDRHGEDLAVNVEHAIEREGSNRNQQGVTLAIDEALVELGRKLNFPRLDFARADGQQVHIQPGEVHWTNFTLIAECREVKLALEAARKRNRTGE